MKGLFYVLPCIELLFSQSVKNQETTIVVGIIEKPYNQVSVYVAWLIWSKRFTIKYR